MKNETVRIIIMPEKKKVNRAFQTKRKIPKKSREVRKNPGCILLAEDRIHPTDQPIIRGVETAALPFRGEETSVSFPVFGS